MTWRIRNLKFHRAEKRGKGLKKAPSIHRWNCFSHKNDNFLASVHRNREKFNKKHMYVYIYIFLYYSSWKFLYICIILFPEITFFLILYHPSTQAHQYIQNVFVISVSAMKSFIFGVKWYKCVDITIYEMVRVSAWAYKMAHTHICIIYLYTVGMKSDVHIRDMRACIYVLKPVYFYWKRNKIHELIWCKFCWNRLKLRVDDFNDNKYFFPAIEIGNVFSKKIVFLFRFT